jgi:hypothetical protein
MSSGISPVMIIAIGVFIFVVVAAIVFVSKKA